MMPLKLTQTNLPDLTPIINELCKPTVDSMQPQVCYHNRCYAGYSFMSNFDNGMPKRWYYLNLEVHCRHTIQPEVNTPQQVCNQYQRHAMTSRYLDHVTIPWLRAILIFIRVWGSSVPCIFTLRLCLPGSKTYRVIRVLIFARSW